MYLSLSFISLLGTIYLAATFVLLVEIVIVALYYLKSHKRNIKLEQKEKFIYQRALDITNEAHEQARNLLTKTEVFKDKLETNITEYLKTANQEHVEVFAKSLNTLSQTFEEKLLDAEVKFVTESGKNLAELKAKRVQQLAELDRAFQGIADFSKKHLQDRLEEEIAKVHEELNSYRQTKIAKFDTSIGGLVKQIVSTVLVNGLTIQNQDQLAHEALEAAKREGMFFPNDEPQTN